MWQPLATVFLWLKQISRIDKLAWKKPFIGIQQWNNVNKNMAQGLFT